ncbi:hypothetical protein [Nocardia sp. CC227C]|uniref:hypothetical protein n=1 Tax=Nocardia sp. CC227C TaxID=3044562 RepID=UPI00278C2EC6|nr:hypothetical protein [Nocardia sp. CC227C]
MRTIRAELDIADRRQYSLVDYRHGHSYAVIRGFPELDDDAPGGSPVQVLDLFFAGVERISCWKDLGPIDVRRAEGAERAELAQRIGSIRPSSVVFYLERGSVESYVIASRLHWAEFDLPYGAVSPLASEESGYRDAYPPVDGVVRFTE